MTTISIRLPEQLLNDVNKIVHELHIPRAIYVRKALENMNIDVIADKRRKRLMEVSKRVRKESMKVNAEFSRIEDAPKS